MNMLMDDAMLMKIYLIELSYWTLQKVFTNFICETRCGIWYPMLCHVLLMEEGTCTPRQDVQDGEWKNNEAKKKDKKVITENNITQKGYKQHWINMQTDNYLHVAFSLIGDKLLRKPTVAVIYLKLEYTAVI